MAAILSFYLLPVNYKMVAVPIFLFFAYTLTFATTRKTRRFTIEGRDIEFRQLKRELFWGYEMEGGIYIARPEKAFLDLVYFASRGKASIDMDEIN